ncbi:hypothetical protein QNI16_07200 [Cytophagaceae bacterium YF14B1]|uniref:Uncharacterized protein n=1 Tax=Xanthocytophaga flava TaxID=3048013 RepID=A0AAE3QNF9_9BACT|nr:hypothetical protein [Xanthocytophaga flavus]MDJ1480265.1 hypothetical protein [Xanthocytophaga flavus]
MAQYTPVDFVTKWADRFADNLSANIKEADFREFSQDIADSFLSPDVQDASTTQKGVVMIAITQAGNTVLSDGRVITGEVLNLVLESIRVRLTQKENAGVAQALVTDLIGGATTAGNTLKKIEDRIANIQRIDRFALDIEDRDMMPVTAVPPLLDQENVYVKDATADTTVETGPNGEARPAIYKWLATPQAWVKTSEPGTIDFDLSAGAISFDPTGTGLTSLKVQAAIIELKNLIDSIESSLNLDNYIEKTGEIDETIFAVGVPAWWTGLVTAGKVKLKPAMDFLQSSVASLQTTVASIQSTVSSIQASISNFYTKLQIDSFLSNKADIIGGKVPEAQLPNFVKTVNNIAPDANGNVTASGGGPADIRKATYTQMIADKPYQDEQNIFVVDASADPTVDAGSAYYKYDLNTDSFTKLSEAESMDLTFTGFTKDVSGENTLDYTPTTPADATDIGVTLTSGKTKIRTILDAILANLKTKFTIPTGTISQYITGNGTLSTLATDVRNVVLTGLGSVNGALAATDSIVLGFSKVAYFIANIATTIRNTVATGLDVNLTGTPADTDTFLQLFGKIIYKINNHTQSKDTLTSSSSGTLTYASSITMDLANKAESEGWIFPTGNFTIAFSNIPVSTSNSLVCYVTLRIVKNVTANLVITVPTNSYLNNDGLLFTSKQITLTGNSGTRNQIALSIVNNGGTIEYWWTVGPKFT